MVLQQMSRLALVLTPVLLTAQAAAQCEIAKLLGTDTISNDRFGSSVRIDGRTMVVGAFNHGPDGAGAAYVFEYIGTEWVEVAKLQSSDLEADDEFGGAIAIDGDTIVIGASQDDDSGSNSGSVYVFVKPAAGWTDATETAKLTASDGAAGDLLSAVAIDVDTIVAGAVGHANEQGAVYVFNRPVSGWQSMTENVKLTASDRQDGDRFGRSVAIDGGTIVVGADRANDVGSGAAYVFQRDGSGWVQTAKLTSSNPEASDMFGITVDVEADLVAVGAIASASPVEGNQPGAVYVFQASGGVWASRSADSRLYASDGVAFERLGLSVAILDSGTVFAGTQAPFREALTAGGVYRFCMPDGGWNGDILECEKLTASDGEVGDQFGTSMHVNGHTLIVGANRQDDAGQDAGIVYVFAGSAGLDYNGNGTPDTCEPPVCEGDWDRDGDVDFDDVLIVLSSWGPCP